MQPGDVLDGKYRCLHQLRAGGMGAVYAATRVPLGDMVAVKMILPSQNSPVNRARFLREAQAAARIRHPNVVQIFDFGEDASGIPYIVMEFLNGPTLEDEIGACRRLPLHRALPIFAQVCAAVEAGHRRGVLHRDLKPSNVMLARMDDGTEAVKVLDFGLALFTGPVHDLKLTTPGVLIGTYPYMSPEQISGAEVGVATDVYTLGVVLYEMVTGKLPFEGASLVALMHRITAGRYKPPRDIVPDLPDAIVDAIDAALTLEPSRRPATPEALAALAGARLTVVHAASSDSSTGTVSGPTSPGGHLTALFDAARDVAPDIEDSQTPDRGRTDPPRAVTTVDAKGLRSEWPEMTRFVGRERELEALVGEYQAAVAGNGRLVVVAGDAGVGKTSLVRVFCHRARGDRALVVSGRFFDYEGSRPAPFEIFLDMIRSGYEARDTAPHGVASLLEQAAAAGDGVFADDAAKWRMMAAIGDEFARLAGERPLVLGFDDLQWAGRLHLDLIGYLQNRLAGDPVFFVGTAREADVRSSSGGELASWLLGRSAARACSILRIGPFTGEEIRAWFNANFGRVRIQPLDLRKLERATGGNAYYLFEVVRHLLATGAITREESAWECAPLDRVELPETVSNVVRAKLQLLDEEMRGVLEMAAVIGDEVRFDTLRAATGLDEERLEALLEAALRLQLLAENGPSSFDDFRFSSATIRRVLYDDIPARRRRRLHGRVVEAFRLVHGDRLDRVTAALCYHSHAMGAWADTLEWGTRAAEEALSRHDIDGAEVSVSRAREAVERMRATGTPVQALDVARLDLLGGTIQLRLGRSEDAKRLLREAAGAAERLGDARLRAAALVELAQDYLARGEHGDAIATGELAAQVAAQAGDAAVGVTARMVVADVLSRLGRHDEAGRRFAELLRECVPGSSLSIQARVLRSLGWVHVKQGAFGLAEVEIRQALDFARAANDLVGQQLALSALAAVYGEQGDNEGAIPYSLESLKLARVLSYRRREGIELANTGEMLVPLGQLAEAEAHLTEALAIFVEIEDRACEGDCRVNLGKLLLASNRPVEAIAMLERGREICEATGRREYVGLALLAIGDARLAQGAPDVARRAFEQARATLREIGAHYLWRAEYGLARVAEREGRSAEALERARSAVAIVEEMGLGETAETSDAYWFLRGLEAPPPDDV
jgi:eukaryotic-like serine/threonine-protein kinase